MSLQLAEEWVKPFENSVAPQCQVDSPKEGAIGLAQIRREVGGVQKYSGENFLAQIFFPVRFVFFPVRFVFFPVRLRFFPVRFVFFPVRLRFFPVRLRFFPVRLLAGPPLELLFACVPRRRRRGGWQFSGESFR